VRIRRRWRSFTTKILSSSSRRSVPIMRSQVAFARGAPVGLVRIWIPSAAKTASNALVNRESRFLSRNFTVITCSPRFISRLRAAWVVHAPVGCAGYAEQMGPAGAVLDRDQRADPSQHHGVHMDEVHG
jgi:hypothetical protein